VEGVKGSDGDVQIFCEVAYRVTSKQELLDGVDEYVDQLVVLPPSIWDPTSRMAPPHQSRSLVRSINR
jgi:hypothetical protein